MTRCPGCHVGPEDECEAGCPATLLVRIGWTAEQAADILEGRPPRGPEVCPCENEQPDPCPACGARVDGPDACQAKPRTLMAVIDSTPLLPPVRPTSDAAADEFVDRVCAALELTPAEEELVRALRR